MSTLFQLKPYQQRAVAHAKHLFAAATPEEPVCVLTVAPTGAGKTVIAGRIASVVSETRPTVWFWFAPFAGVVEQAAEALKVLCPELRIRDVYQDRVLEDVRPGDLYITTWAAVASTNASSKVVRSATETRASLDEVIAHVRSEGWSVGVIADEAHHGFVKAEVASAFYRDVLSPEMTLLITATPDDKPLESFRQAAGLTDIAEVSVSRADAVRAGLVKDGVKAVSFVIPPESKHLRPDVIKATLRHAWARHQDVKRLLGEIGQEITPLMLVQVDSEDDSVQNAREVLLSLGVPESAIAVHTAKEPDPDVLAVARDPDKEVLIFKMAVALGFDAPRAWVLASLRNSADTNFGIQLVGRVLRVERRLQGLDVPEPLRYGYVYVGDLNTQGGLASAAERLGTLSTHLTTPTHAGQTADAAQAARAAPSTGSIDQVVQEIAAVAPVAEAYQVLLGMEEGVGSAPQDGLPRTADDVLRDLVPEQLTLGAPLSVPQGDFFSSLWSVGETQATVAHAVTPIVATANAAAGPPAIHRYSKRSDIATPSHLYVMRYPAGADIAAAVANQVIFDDAALAILSRKAMLVRRELDLWAPMGEGVREERTTEELDARRLQKAGAQCLMGDNFIDGEDMLPHLARRLEEACRERGYEEWYASPDRLEAGVLQILGADPRILRDAVQKTLAHFAVSVPAEEALPADLVGPPAMPAPRNLYGVMPEGLNTDEREIAMLLESAAYGNVLWWHRNAARARHSAFLRVPGLDDRFFPDFVVAVRGRPTRDGILLIDPHGSHLIDNLQKVGAAHTDYKRVLVLAKDKHGVWYEQRLGPDGQPEHGRRLSPDLLLIY
jgi:hypothetical protein